MEVQGKMCEDLKMVFFSWCALLLPCLIPYLAQSLCLRTHFCSIWWHCMSQVRLTGEKQQDRSPTTVCEHLFASSLVSEHPLSLETCSTSAGAGAVQSQGAAQAPPRTFHHLSFSETFLLKLLNATSTACLDVSCLPAPNVAPSLRVLLPQKSIAKLQVISAVAGLGLTSLAFIRNTSLGLCWYKST